VASSRKIGMVKEEDTFVIVLLGFLMIVVLGSGWMMFMPMLGFMGHGWFGFFPMWPPIVALIFAGVAIVGLFLLLQPRRREDAR